MAPPWYLLLLVGLVGALKCPDGSVCSNDKTCCSRTDGDGYGCCLLKKGATQALPMITDIFCTKQAGCPEEYFCVTTPQGDFACCPLAQGTSCQDGHHCCPSGTHCSEDGYSCLPASNQSAIICPDGISECPSGSTCCQMADQSWGCCPLEEATCCSDHAHCCPHGTLCDLEHDTCFSGDKVVPMSKKVPARVKLQTSTTVKCDDTASCPDSTTCCRLASGDWGCCPFEKAVCCSDKVHCCPNGYTCTGSSCEQNQNSIPWLKKIPALKEENKLKGTDVQCDATTSCPDKTTCCRLPSGEWGCCPIEQAVCCSDQSHCCPSGWRCGEQATCSVGQLSLPWLGKTLTKAQAKCDKSHSCPQGTTCCHTEGGGWDCCPLEEAVCCSDHLHCCPSGYTCNVGTGTCNKPVNVPMTKNVPARVKVQASAAVRRTPCPDGSSCPDGSTCCESSEHSFGCCPLISAVCCGDHTHCCPSGTTCDLAHKKCVSKDSETPMFTKIPPLQAEAVKCDDTTSCPDTTTCCRLASGDWGCCPFEQAVCCSDKIHCCPNGYTCTDSGCERNKNSIPWLKKIPALKEKTTDVPCDPTTYCPDKTTCCRLSSGEWGCCPIEQAVCCSDHLHCCPSGYTCDVETGSCNKAADEPVTPAAGLDYVWCDTIHTCYDGQTCCVGPSGAWSCCPYTQGVCCPDRIHCCPYGFVCLNYGAQCTRSGGLQWDLGWIKKKQPTL